MVLFDEFQVSSVSRTALEYAPGRGHHHPLKTEANESSYMDMSDFFGDSSTAVAVAAALPLHNGGLYGVATTSSSSLVTQSSSTLPGVVDFSDLSHDAMRGAGLLNHALHPMSNASLGSRGSDDDVDDSTSKSQDMSDLGKAFNVMNDEFQYN